MNDGTNNILMLFSYCTHIALRRKILLEPSSGVWGREGGSNSIVGMRRGQRNGDNAVSGVGCGGTGAVP